MFEMDFCKENYAWHFQKLFKVIYLKGLKA